MRRVSGAICFALACLVILNPCRAERLFEPLFQVSAVEGTCLIQPPEGGMFVPAVESKAYPYGSVVRTLEESSISVFLSALDKVALEASSEAQILRSSVTNTARVVTLRHGSLSTFLSTETVPDGQELSNMLSLNTPVATCDKIQGIIWLTLTPGQDTTELVVKTEDGATQIEGPQFSVPEMKNYSSIRISSANDGSFTKLVNLRGDYDYRLDRGTMEPVQTRARPEAVAKLWRQRTRITDRLVVSVLVSKPDGTLDQRYSFREGEAAEGAFDAAKDIVEETTTSTDTALPGTGLDLPETTGAGTGTAPAKTTGGGGDNLFGGFEF